MKKILIIEPDAEFRKHTAGILTLANYEVIAAADGHTGIDLALREKPDLILCAHTMAEMNGYETLYFLCKNPLTTHIPFVFISGQRDIADLRKGMNMGADDYLFKPFDKMELLTCVETRLKKNERFMSSFTGNIEGLNEFLKSADRTEELKRILAESSPRNLTKKEVIYKEGEIAFYVIYVVQGTVKTYFNNEAGKEFITGLNHPGDFVGIVDLLTCEVCRESAMAAEDSEIVLIPKNDFFRVFMSNHEVSLRIIHLLSKNSLEMRERLFHIAYNSVRKRTASALLSFLQITPSENGHAKISITRDDLAAVIGITPESVSRTLHDFKDEKLIDFKNKSKDIVILKKEKLVEMKN